MAIETATEAVGVAVRSGSGTRAAFTLEGRRRHVEILVPALEHVVAQLGLAVADLDLVAVDLGPGLFTGLRVGVAAAKGLARSLGIGIVGLSSLDILARAAADCGHGGPVLAVVDARRGEVFASLRGGRGEPGAGDLLGPGLFSPAVLTDGLRELGGVPIVGVGDGAQRYAGVLQTVPGVSCVMDALGWPPPSTLLAMAEEQLGAGVAPRDPRSVVPQYMREADAIRNFAQITTS
ncbi:MAG: tRNA (adenosine(37)-N6)-threonylcarbamoyltransferase complex dimerization subunit type 1 TsaB [Acidimicrobiales bacterium]